MIDPATGWFEIHQYNDKRSITVANIAEQEWFSRYPWPTQITYDRGSEFIDIMQVNDNGTVRLKVNAVEDTYNIRRIIPYHTAPDPDHGGECNMRTAKNKRKHISEV